MTAYVHIGTAKTGTTSIQDFLKLNYELLLNKGFLYPKSLHGIEEQYSREWSQHRELASIIKTTKNKGFSREYIEKLNLFYKEIYGVENVIISSEMLHDSLVDESYILHCKSILNDLGFKKIKIIVYLRESADLFQSICSQSIKNCYDESVCFKLPSESLILNHRCSHNKTLFNWGKVFGKDNLIVRLFDKNIFFKQDLLMDFIHCLSMEWNEQFVIPRKANESLDVIGCEILQRINKDLPLCISGKINHLRGDLLPYVEKHFSDSKLKFMPPKEVYQSYIDYFEESNEWVRKEFFPHKERLFPKKDLSDYKENYELKEMKPEYWDRIAGFIADIVKTKNQAIVDKTTIIRNKDKLIVQKNQQIQQKDQIIQTKNQELTSKNQELESKTQQLTQIKNQLDSTKNQLDTTQKELDSKVKQMDSQIKNLESSQNQSNLKIQRLTEANQQLDLKNQQLTQTNSRLNLKAKELNFTLRYGTAKSRIHNHLSYKLGQAMIENSKSLLGYIRMPYVLSYIKDKHKQEQQQYQEAIKKNPNLKLPTLESYPDYQESLKEKECLTYKLGEAFIKANKAWYKGGYVKLWFEAKRLEREYREKRVERG